MPGRRVDGEELAKEVADLYSDATFGLVKRVVRRLAGGLDDPGWAERKLAETDQLRRQAMQEVARITEEAAEHAEEVTARALQAGAQGATADLENAGERVRGELVRTDQDTVQAFARQATGALDGARPQILRSVEDSYRSAIRDTAGRVAAGTETRREAAARAVERMAADGLGGFTDSAGRTWELESYAEMATRTATGRASVAGYMDTLERHGHDLVIVSASAEPCEQCDPWEGLVLSMRGDTSGEAVASTQEAESAGLLHANCRHEYGMYVPGATDKPDRPPKEERRERYENRQRQREIERRIREWKRREAALSEIDPEQAKSARAKIREWQAKARSQAGEPGGKRRYDREQPGSR